MPKLVFQIENNDGKSETVDISGDDFPSMSTVNSSENAINNDFDKYLRYIWVPEDCEEDYCISKTSFRIDKINDKIISGKFSPDPALPEVFDSRNEYLQYNENNVKGRIINGIAECEFTDLGKGHIRLIFIDKYSIIAEIDYKEKDDHYNYYKSGTFAYRPFNIKDHLLFVENKDLEVNTKLDTWGDVRIISGRQETNHAVAWIYMTDENGNIFYSFGAPYQHDSVVVEVIVEDINNDDLLDVKIITSIHEIPQPDDPEALYFIWNFYQLDNGWFYMERA